MLDHFLIPPLTTLSMVLCIAFVNQPGINHGTAWWCTLSRIALGAAIKSTHQDPKIIPFFPPCLISNLWAHLNFILLWGPGGGGSRVCCLPDLGNIHSARGGSGVGHSEGASRKRWPWSVSLNGAPANFKTERTLFPPPPRQPAHRDRILSYSHQMHNWNCPFASGPRARVGSKVGWFRSWPMPHGQRREDHRHCTSAVTTRKDKWKRRRTLPVRMSSRIQ